METGTLTDRVYETIKQKILSGEFADGERLNLTELARQLNVSNSPLREAMSRLEKVGLVRVVPYRGPFVRSLSPLDVTEIFDVRIALETLAVRLVA
ncbi:MAG: GntR family transcriptional regulator, partial [Chloroflexi bacterium]